MRGYHTDKGYMGYVDGEMCIRDRFIAQWKKLEELCERIFHPISGTPMDELQMCIRDRHTLFDYEVTKTEKDKELSEQNLVESFLSAKRIDCLLYTSRCV